MAKRTQEEIDRVTKLHEENINDSIKVTEERKARKAAKESQKSTPLWNGGELKSVYETPEAKEMMEEYKASPEHQAVRNEAARKRYGDKIGWTPEGINGLSPGAFIPSSPSELFSSDGSKFISTSPMSSLMSQSEIKENNFALRNPGYNSLSPTVWNEERLQEAISAPQKKANFKTWFNNNVMAGFNQFNKSLMSTLDWILPTEFLGRYDFISNLNDYYSDMYDSYSTKAYNAGVSRGTGWEYGGQFLSGTVSALPNSVIALLTAGASLGGSALGSGSSALSTAAGSSSSIGMLKKAVTEMAKKPVYWSSFLQTVGTDYEEAKQNGANEFIASTSAIITSLLNAGIEVSGGIEQLPNSIKHGGKRAVLNWVTSSVDEGKEEVLQGIVTDGIARLMYDTDRDTLNPKGRLYDFAMGAGVGGILGGAQIGAIGAVNAFSRRNTTSNAGYKNDFLNGYDTSTFEGVQNTGIDNYYNEDYANSLYNDGTDANTKATATGVNDNAAGVKYFTGDVINDNNISIKDQLRNSAEKINSMEPVYKNDSIYVTDKGRAENLNDIMKIFEDIDYKVERSDIGTIVLDKKRISNSLRYLQTDGELAAYSALPDVLEKGIEINYKEEHKRRPYETFTFAAPVVINGQEGYMGVVVRRDNGTNYYKVHRILMPDGSTFVYENRINSAERAAGHSQSEIAGSPAVAVYDNNISQQSPIVNSPEQNNVDNEQINRSYENYNPNEAQALIKSLDKNGIKAFDSAYSNEVSKGSNVSRFEFLRRYNRYYVAGLTGRSKAQVDRLYADSISQSSANAAYKAGQADRALQLDRENAQINKVVKNEGGLYKNANSEKLSSDTASFIDKMAKDLGVGVEFLDDVKTKGGKSVNGQYSDGKIKISMKTLNDSRIDSSELKNKIAQQIFKHEITHRVQELAPKQFEKVKDLIYSYVNDTNMNNISPAEKQLIQEFKSGVEMNYSVAIDEIAADFVASPEFANYAAAKDKNLAQKILDVIRDILDKVGVKKYTELERIARNWEKAVEAAKKNANKANSPTKNTGNGKIKYSLAKFAERDVNYALTNKNYTEDVYLTENSPSIIVNQKGARNLPMLMKASHIRENVFTESEAKKRGLKTGDTINYHGLGKDLFLKIIDGLDNVTLAYRGTKNAENPARRENYFLLISQYKDSQGNTINVPVYINEKGQYNRVFLDTNKIATVFGRNNFNEYINKEIQKGNLVRIKNRDVQVSELTSPINASYNKNASDKNIIQQETEKVNTNNKNNSQKNSTKSIDELIRDNKKLQKQADHFKSQFRQTEKFTIRESDAKKIVKAVADGYTGDLNLEQEMIAIGRMLGKFVNFKAKTEADYSKNNQLFSEAREKMVEVGYDIARNTLKKNDETAKTFEDIKSYLKGTKIKVSDAVKKDLEAIYDKYGNFTRHNFGRMVFNDRGVTIDTVWAELNGMFGDMFPKDVINPTDQVIFLNDLLDEVDVIYYNPYSGDMEEASEYIADNIQDLFFTSSMEYVKTYADRQKTIRENAVQREREKNAERVSRTREEYKERIDKAISREREKRNAMLADARAKYNQKMRDRIDHDKAKRAQKREMNTRKELLTLARRMDKIKTTPDNRVIIDELLKDIDLVSLSLTNRSIQNLRDLSDYYHNELMKMSNFVPDPRIEDNIKRLELKHIKDMDIEDVKSLIETLRSIEHSIRTHDKLIASEDRRNVYTQGREVIQDINNSGGVKKYGFSYFTDYVKNGILSPVRALRSFTGYHDGDALVRAGEAIRHGQTVQMNYEMNAIKPFLRFLNNRNFMKSFSGKHAKFENFTVNIYEGKNKVVGTKKITLTPAMKVSLYLHNNNIDNKRHISTGGVTIPDMKLYKMGKIEEAYNSGETVKIAQDDINKIIANMTVSERAFADTVEYYFNTVSKKAINEVSIEKLGYEVATVSNYFPIETNKNFLNKEFEMVKDDGSIDGMGFLKSRVDGANNPIYLRDVNEVLQQAIRMHSKYVGFSIPVGNFNKLYNVQTRTYTEVEDRDNYGHIKRDADGNPIMKPAAKNGYEDSIKNAIAKMWGQHGIDYIRNMMVDVQGANRDRRDGFLFLQPLTNHSALGILGLNASVAFNQVAGFAAAAYEVGWRPVLGSMIRFGKVDLELIAKYTPLQWARTQGKYDPTVADLRNVGLKIPKAFDWMTATDAWVTRKVWKMSELYVRQNFKDLKIGTDTFYEQVADVYERTMYETQPNSTVMERPAFLRADTLTRALLVFKGEPLKNINVLYESVANLAAKQRQYRQAKGTERENIAKQNLKKAQIQFYRGISSFVIGQVLYTLVTSPIKFLFGGWERYKDEEEDKYTLASVVKRLTVDFLQNTLTMGPFGSEIFNVVNALFFKEKYWGTDIFVTSQIDAVVESVIAFSQVATKFSDNETTSEDFTRSAIDALSSLGQNIIGIPTENVLKIFKAIGIGAMKVFNDNTIIEDFYALRFDGPIIEKSIDDNGTEVFNATSKTYDILYKAAKTNDKEAYNKILFTLLKEGVKQSKIQSAMTSRFKKDNIPYSETLGAYAGIKLRYDEEVYEKYLDDGYEIGLARETTEEAINIILDKTADYSDMIDDIRNFISDNGLDETQSAFFMEIAEEQFGIDDLTAKQFEKYSVEYDRMSKEIENEINFDLYDNEHEKNDVLTKIFDYADAQAKADASDGEFKIHTQWINECARSEETIGVSQARFIELYSKYGSSVYGEKAIEYKNLGYNVENFLAYNQQKNALSGVPDANNDTISYSVVWQETEVIDKMNISEKEKIALFTTARTAKIYKNKSWNQIRSYVKNEFDKAAAKAPK